MFRSDMTDVRLAPALEDYALPPPVEVFALAGQGVNNYTVGLRTGAGEFVAREYASYDGRSSIDYEHALLRRLASAGLSFAVPVPVPSRTGEAVVHGPTGWISLARRLPGTTLDLSVPGHAELLGTVVGEMQSTLACFPLVQRPGRPLFERLLAFPPPERDPRRVTPGVLGLPATPDNDRLLGWWREEVVRLQEILDGPYRALRYQVCHNDVTPPNVLVHEGQVSAVLDFEFAGPAPRALDVAHTLRLVLRSWEEHAQWEECRHFCRGYRRWVCLSEAEVSALPWLARVRHAITVLWWLGRPDAAAKAAIVPVRTAHLQRYAAWQAQHGEQLVEVAQGALR
jgi:Ser/Thr protein kinase RdoA (MazF antagonist)